MKQPTARISRVGVPFLVLVFGYVNFLYMVRLRLTLPVSGCMLGKAVEQVWHASSGRLTLSS
jgi:hypothetical protein